MNRLISNKPAVKDLQAMDDLAQKDFPKLRGYKTYQSAKSALTRTDARRPEDFRDNEIYETKIGWAFFDRQGYIHLPGRIVDPRCHHAIKP